MSEVLQIQDFEDKKTAAKKNYTRFKTSAGWMSCFDAKSCEELKKLKGNSANVEIKESGDFKNIKKFLSAASETPEVEIEKIEGKKKMNLKEMYVSYAKDAFCAIVTRISQSKFDDLEDEEVLGLMELAIKAIKKAESAF